MHKYDKQYFHMPIKPDLSWWQVNSARIKAKKQINSFLNYLNCLFEYRFRCHHYLGTQRSTDKIIGNYEGQMSLLSEYAKNFFQAKQEAREYKPNDSHYKAIHSNENMKISSDGFASIQRNFDSILGVLDFSEFSKEEVQAFYNVLNSSFKGFTELIKTQKTKSLVFKESGLQNILKEISRAAKVQEREGRTFPANTPLVDQGTLSSLVYRLANNYNLYEPIRSLGDHLEELRQVARAFGASLQPGYVERYDGRSPEELLTDHKGLMSLKPGFLGTKKSVTILSPQITQGDVYSYTNAQYPALNDSLNSAHLIPVTTEKDCTGAFIASYPKLSEIEELARVHNYKFEPGENLYKLYGVKPDSFTVFRYCYKCDDALHVRFGSNAREKEGLSPGFKPSHFRIAYVGTGPKHGNNTVNDIHYGRTRIPLNTKRLISNDARGNDHLVLGPWHEIESK